MEKIERPWGKVRTGDHQESSNYSCEPPDPELLEPPDSEELEPEEPGRDELDPEPVVALAPPPGPEPADEAGPPVDPELLEESAPDLLLLEPREEPG